MTSITIDQRKLLAREASERDVSPRSLLTDQFPGMTDRAMASMLHEVEWEVFAQSTQRNGNMEEGRP